MKKRFLMSILALFLIGTPLTGCSNTNSNSTSNVTVTSGATESIGSASTFINLGSNISITGDSNGVSLSNNKVTILSGGTYCISGSIDDGQIIVDAAKESGDVYIILNGVNITCSDSAPIYVKNSPKTVIGLADNTQNYITDGDNYVYDTDTDEPNAAIYSKDDITFIGDGSLEVNANFNDGITGKDDLRIENGNITVNSKGDGIRGRDSLTITDGNLVINSGGEALKSNNDTDEGKGNINIEGGTINITSNEDAIQAVNNITSANADITITCGGGSENAPAHTEEMGGRPMRTNTDAAGSMDMASGMPPNMQSDMNPTATEDTPPTSDIPPATPADAATSTEDTTLSTKGIKAGSDITINSGTFNINSCDDAIHSNNTVTINGGTINISTGDDAIHADTVLEINDGDITISKSYEGLEGETITINGGNIYVTSSDDGVNASGSSETASEPGNPGSGGAPNESSGTGLLNINGGYLFVDASGDGLDANGSINMTDGTVIVNGPSDNGNGALDYDNKFEITGGFLIAAGSSGMAQSPSDTSSQNFVSATLSSQSAGTIVHLENSAGESIATFAPLKQFQSIVISSADIKNGETYKLSVGGSSNSEAVNGLYSNGSYSGGDEIKTFTISGINTSVVQDGVTVSSGMGGGGRGGMGNKPFGDRTGTMGNNGTRPTNPN